MTSFAGAAQRQSVLARSVSGDRPPGRKTRCRMRPRSPSSMRSYHLAGSPWWLRVLSSPEFLLSTEGIPRICKLGVEPQGTRAQDDARPGQMDALPAARFRCLKTRYEQRAAIHLAFLKTGCALVSSGNDVQFARTTCLNRRAWSLQHQGNGDQETGPRQRRRRGSCRRYRFFSPRSA